MKQRWHAIEIPPQRIVLVAVSNDENDYRVRGEWGRHLSSKTHRISGCQPYHGKINLARSAKCAFHNYLMEASLKNRFSGVVY
jgi:hypothetical protein